jgi:sulfonate transport system permease protein
MLKDAEISVELPSRERDESRGESWLARHLDLSPGSTVEIVARKKPPRKRGVPGEIRRLYAPVGLVALWAVLSATHLLSSRMFPAPWEVVQAGIRLTLSGELAKHLGASLLRVMEGGVPGIAIGIFLAIIAGTIKVFEDSIDSLMQILKSIPEFTIVPLLIIWMGINDMPKITLIMLSVASPIYLNMYGAIRGVDQRLVESSKTLGLGYWQRAWHIVLPGSMPGLFMGLRIAFTAAWLSLVFADTINAQNGLGRLMSDARSWWQLDVMLLVIMIYAMLGLASQLLLRAISHRVLAWRNGYNGE